MLPGEKEFRSLLAIITDPQKFAARVDELAGREQAAKDAIERASAVAPQAQAKLDEAHGLIHTATQEREKLAAGRAVLSREQATLRDAEARFNAERIAIKSDLKKREDAVAENEKRLASALSDLQAKQAQVEQTLAEAQALRAQFQAKLEAIQKAAA